MYATLLSGITGFRIEALEYLSLPGNGPGMFSNGNFQLTELTVGHDAFAGPAVDHYLSYKTKATKGDICSDESAPDQVGMSCETEEDCGGSSGPDTETGFCVPNKFPKGLRVTLSDELDSSNRLFDVKKPLALYTPADKNSEGVQDPDTHLRSYLIALTKKRCSSGRQLGGGVHDGDGLRRDPEGHDVLSEPAEVRQADEPAGGKPVPLGRES